MKRIISVFIFAAILFTCTSCAAASSDDFFAMDTVMSFSAYGKNAADAVRDAEDEVKRIDALLSITGTDSDIRRVNSGSGGEVSGETAALIGRAVDISNETDGAFDLTVYPVVDAWGFYGDTQKVPDDGEIASALACVGADGVKIDGVDIIFSTPGMMLDLGGIAKGYAASRAADAVRARGVESAVLSLGGNVRLVGRKSDGALWRVGIVDPNKTDAYACVVEAEDCAVVTSGGYQRFFEENGTRYHHIIDTKTGYPADNGIISATVVSSDDVLADALSTALFVMGEERAASFWRENAGKFDMILLTDDGRAVVTEGIASVFTAEAGYKTEVLTH